MSLGDAYSDHYVFITVSMTKLRNPNIWYWHVCVGRICSGRKCEFARVEISRGNVSVDGGNRIILVTHLTAHSGRTQEGISTKLQFRLRSWPQQCGDQEPCVLSLVNIHGVNSVNGQLIGVLHTYKGEASDALKSLLQKYKFVIFFLLFWS